VQISCQEQKKCSEICPLLSCKLW